MITTFLIIAFLVSALTGVTFVYALWPAGDNQKNLFVILTLGIPFGVGLSTLPTFICRMMFWNFPAVLAADLSFLAIGVTWAFSCWHNRTSAAPMPKSFSVLSLTSAVVLGLGLLMAVFAGIHWVQASPFGFWDAWAMWNTKARFIYLGDSNWTEMFRLTRMHPDYPLLLPMVIARLWIYQGTASTHAAQSMAVIWPLLVASVITAVVAALRGRVQGGLAALIFLTSYKFLHSCAWQYADAPLALFMTIALGTTAFGLTRPETHGLRLFLLIGVATGLAAWTKNEGFLFAVALLLAVIIVSLFTADWGIALGRALMLLMGALPFFLLAMCVKTLYATGQNDLFAAQSSTELFTRLCDPDRHRQILTWIYRSAVNAPSPLLILLPPYVVLLGIARGAAARHTISVLGLCLLIMVLGYYLVYCLTPHDLNWHLRTSFDRLLIHLWPGTVLLLFLVMRSPEELFRSSTSATSPY